MAGQRINIGLKEELHAKAKALAAIKGISLNEFFEEAVKSSVGKDKKLFEAVK
ncbi:toxin-antitoxin system HicB family antitoxin [Candidatus Woesearchaeota archaeon]|nr:toxin-antitoxin system HicB family antitoxin [Candidatus Woesearchaeota archaeon]